MFWFGWNAHNGISLLLWVQRVVFLPLALMFVLFAWKSFEPCSWSFGAAFETVQGIARNVEDHTGERRAKGRAMRLELDVRRVQLMTSRAISIREGDEVVVAGEQLGDVLVGIAYRNVTRSFFCRAWSATGMFLTPLCLILILVAVAGLWSNGSGDAIDIWIAVRRLLALGVFIGAMLFA